MSTPDTLPAPLHEVLDTFADVDRGLRAELLIEYADAFTSVPDAVARIGGDVGRLPGIIDTLVSTHGTSRKLTVDDVTPFLGQAGMVPVYELANEIDKGDARGALVILHRMLDAGEIHALQVLRVLHNHFERLLRLDGADVAGPREAMDLLGLKSKSDYPGQKALEQLGRLGSDGVRDAIQLIAEADIHLRGGRDWPPELVMEVLVARLARQALPSQVRVADRKSTRLNSSHRT